MSSTDSNGHYYRGMGLPMVDCRPQPIEPNSAMLNSSRILPSPSVSAVAHWETLNFPHDFGELSPHGHSHMARQVQTDNQARGTPQEPLAQWYAAQDGPWDPLRVPVQGHSRSRISDTRISMQQENQFRSPFPSDGSQQFGHPPSDSGYGSNGARRSDENGSIFSSDIPDREDCSSLPSHIPDFAPWHGMPDPLSSRELHPTEWNLHGVSRVSSQANLVCPDCHKTVKTRSELKYET